MKSAGPDLFVTHFSELGGGGGAKRANEIIFFKKLDAVVDEKTTSKNQRRDFEALLRADVRRARAGRKVCQVSCALRRCQRRRARPQRNCQTHGPIKSFQVPCKFGKVK
tara:strand:- start:170 stop:496 length:327 start_codon:yes stop_codon:yes gene_type:complete